MAVFDPALAFVLANEGGYSNDKGDTGGETYCGISRNNFPAWPGWALIDATGPEHINASALVQPVADFYRKNFWAAIQGDLIKDQDVATRLFDMAVNAGVGEAAKLIQRAAHVTADGVIGPATIAAINSSVSLLPRFRARRAQFYAQAYARDPQRLDPFLYGWMLRNQK